ncbi:MAG: hypothetical protein CUN52_10375 [Phototrophicales bacterium]|nr:MAG: hypothetical protein CUN52_10375 [Phototrophicales bacterium]
MKLRLTLLFLIGILLMGFAMNISAQDVTPVREPYVTARLNANVRAGDGTSYRRITVLLRDQRASIIGINARRTWYQIQLTNGRIGWVGSSVVTVTGDLTNVPVVASPALTPGTAISTPTPAPTISLSDLSASPPKLEPSSPACNVAFNILVNINNAGPNKTNSPATIYIENIYNGATTNAFTTVLPEINSKVDFVVGGSMTVNTGGGGTHTIRVTIDPENRVTETNENNNVVSTTYTLTGSC